MNSFSCSVSFQAAYAERYPREVRKIKIFLNSFMHEAVKPLSPRAFPRDGVPVSIDHDLDRHGKVLLVDIGLPPSDELYKQSALVVNDLVTELTEVFPDLVGHLDVEAGPVRARTAR